MALVGSFPFNSFLSGVLSCIGTAVLAGKFSISYKIKILIPCECTHLVHFFVYSLPPDSSEQRKQGIQGS